MEDSSNLLLNMWKDAESEICEELNIDILIPRRTGKQIQRSNVMANTPEEYYRLSVFIPFLDSIISQIGDRLLKHKCFGKLHHSGFIKEKNATTLIQKYEGLINTDVIDEGIGNLKL